MRLIALLLCPLLLSALIRAADDHPLKNAKIGDWVEYKVTEESGGETKENTERMEITKNDGKIVAYNLVKQSKKTKMSSEVPLYLDVPCDPEDPNSPISIIKCENVKYKITGKGKEALTIAGKKYDCQWVTRSISYDAGKTKTERAEYESKVWNCADVPLFGWVRKEYTHSSPQKGKVIYELACCGKGQ